MRGVLFIVVLFHFSYIQAQVAWVYESEYSVGRKILESYDGGTLILATVDWQLGDGRLFKLNKMGEVLWEYAVTDDTESLSASKLEELTNGDILIGGRTYKYEAWGDAFF